MYRVHASCVHMLGLTCNYDDEDDDHDDNDDGDYADDNMTRQFHCNPCTSMPFISIQIKYNVDLQYGNLMPGLRWWSIGYDSYARWLLLYITIDIHTSSIGCMPAGTPASAPTGISQTCPSSMNVM
jgi:hypothetical protein